jgi:hypothetical protein
VSKYWSDALVPKGHYSDHAYKMLNDPEYAYKHGISETEQRIIKLLERLWEKTQGTDLPAVVVLPEAIELIKGETNESYSR